MSIAVTLQSPGVSWEAALSLLTQWCPHKKLSITCFPPSQQHLALPLRIFEQCERSFTCRRLCRSASAKGRSWSGGVWQLLRAPSLRWQMCHTGRALTCLVAANCLTMAPMIFQFTMASNTRISRQKPLESN